MVVTSSIFSSHISSRRSGNARVHLQALRPTCSKTSSATASASENGSDAGRAVSDRAIVIGHPDCADDLYRSCKRFPMQTLSRETVKEAARHLSLSLSLSLSPLHKTQAFSEQLHPCNAEKALQCRASKAPAISISVPVTTRRRARFLALLPPLFRAVGWRSFVLDLVSAHSVLPRLNPERERIILPDRPEGRNASRPGKEGVHLQRRRMTVKSGSERTCRELL
jgi:hypothetical protein